MARGWESKAIEQQQDEAADRRTRPRAPLSPEETMRAQALEVLRLARARTLADLQRACRPAHRGMLEQQLADIDCRIAEFQNVQ